MLLRAVQDFDLTPEECLMIGDKESNVEATRRSGVPGMLIPGEDLLQAVRDALETP